MGALFLGVNFEIALYLVIAKVCLFFHRNSVFLIVIVIGCIRFLGYLTNFAQQSQINSSYCQLFIQNPQQFLPLNLFGNTLGYIISTTFVVLFSLVLISEQNSRRQAVALAKEVETLAATLERNRIARDIHDTLGHALTTLDIQLEVAQRLRQQDPRQSLQAVDMAKSLAGQCIQDVRRSLETLHESDFNLKQSLLSLLEKIKQAQPYTIKVNLNLPELPLQTSHQLYCVIQEGLTNIQKHANASNITLMAETNATQIVLRLSDDGQGFDPVASHTGYGLRGMIERVQILGGELKIRSAPSQGTQIEVMLPL